MDDEPKRRLLTQFQSTVVPLGQWALRGGETGLSHWLQTEGGKDIDLWVSSESLEAFCTSLSYESVGAVSLETDPRWLRHVVFVMSEEYAGQLVDVTFGDLKVGAAMTCREALVTTASGSFGPQLTGVAAVSDLLLRKLLRGKSPNAERLDEARRHWHDASSDQRDAWLSDLGDTLGARLVARVQSLLGGGEVTPRDRFDFVIAAIRCSWRMGGRELLLRRRRRMVFGRRRRTLLKRPVAPVLFHLSGKWDDKCAANLVTALRNIGADVKCLDVPARHSLLDGCSVAVRLAQCWLFGKAAVLVDERECLTTRSIVDLGVDALFDAGGIIRLHGPGSSTPPAIREQRLIEHYYLAAHRWYIDEPVVARRLCRHKSAKSQSPFIVES